MKKKVIAGIIGIAAIVAITVGIVIVNQKPELATSTVTIEAGEEFKPEAKDLFKGKHSGDVKIDTSKVDTDKVGEYEATATYKKHSYTITVKVEDTTAPTITAKSEDPVYTKDVTALNAEDYVTVEDVSDTTVAFTGYQKMDSLDAEPITEATATVPEEEGFYKATITATDASNNESDTTITLVYDKTAPTIEGLADGTTESDPTEDSIQCTATDAIDGAVDVTKSIEKTGDNQYTVIAKATDRAGNEATQSATITVQAPQPVAEAPAQESASNETTKNASKGSSSKGSGSGSASNKGGNAASGNGGSTQTTPAQQAPAEQPAAPEQQPAQVEQPAQDNNSSAGSDGSSNDSLDRYRQQDAERAETIDWACPWCGIDFGYGQAASDQYAEHMRSVHGAPL
ncbi:hypothetical protein FYJ75_02895 [Roseburia sp. MUC/MUC-530-WT-4D]|uniref:Uncharacterized protein n=1 Tax=Roseburia porci TaxID=2605790 RepID=A0A6L5YNG4_9FIRM|nr:hypothetical protein [Roseburia porci]MST73985.1 hypothetical protein [Roseburia porci]